MPELVIANKVKFARDEALALARRAERVVASKGKKVVILDLAEADDDAVAAVILGRAGTLRAPAIHAGDAFVVGFNADAYADVFG